MAGDYQKTIIVGRLGRDPEMRYTPSGKAITQFTVAVGRSWKQDNEWVEETTWFRVIIWGEPGERANEQLHKGSKVLIEGRMQMREYEDKDEIKRQAWELVADRYVNMSPRERDEGDGSEDRPRRQSTGNTSRRRTSGNRSATEDRTPAGKEPADDLSDLDDLPFS